MTSEKKRVNEVDDRANRLSQTLIFAYLSDYQASRSESKVSKHACELPVQVFTGLSVYQLTRSSNVVIFLHSLGLSVHYSRIWETLNTLAKSVVVKMNANGGLHRPPDIVHGRFKHFAIGNRISRRHS